MDERVVLHRVEEMVWTMVEIEMVCVCVCVCV